MRPTAANDERRFGPIVAAMAYEGAAEYCTARKRKITTEYQSFQFSVPLWLAEYSVLSVFSTPINGGHILNRTYGTHKNLYISLFLPTKFGPIYYGPPQ